MQLTFRCINFKLEAENAQATNLISAVSLLSILDFLYFSIFGEISFFVTRDSLDFSSRHFPHQKMNHSDLHCTTENCVEINNFLFISFCRRRQDFLTLKFILRAGAEFALNVKFNYCLHHLEQLARASIIGR